MQRSERGTDCSGKPVTPAHDGGLRREAIASCARPRCGLCGEIGTPLYEELRDELFGAPGIWGIRRCGNPQCGLIWLDPAPLASELPKAYRNYYTHFNEDMKDRKDSRGRLRARLVGLYGHVVHYSGLLEARRRMLVRHLENIEPGRLLEIGCGDGSFLSVVRECGWQVTGVDSDPLAAKAALQKYGIEVQVELFEDCEFPQGHFDVIVMNHVIEHVLDPVTLLSSCDAILSNEGVLLLVTPNSAGLGHATFGRNWMGLDPPRHLQVFSPVSLGTAAQRAGLRYEYLGTSSVNAEAIFWGSTVWGSTVMRGERALKASPPPLGLLFRSWLYQCYSLAMNLWNREGGEEIVMLCRKDFPGPGEGVI